MTPSANPYILTPLTDGAGFYGRDAVLQFVRNTLTSPYQNVIVLFGQRRIGKTSVLHQLKQPGQTPPGFRAVYFDLQGRAEHRLDQVLYGLAREISRALGIEISPRGAFADESFFQYAFLPRVYRVLDGDRLLVLVDEFDVLGGEEVTADAAYHVLFGFLQDLLIDEQRGLTFVFVVGRRLDELPSRIKATFKSAQCKRISVLDREAAQRLIVQPAGNTLRYDAEAVDHLLALTSGHPYFLQLLCYELFDRAMREGRHRVAVEDISADVLVAAMELGMGGLAWFWDEFPPAERFILSTVAHLTEHGEVATLRDISQALHQHGVRMQGMELSTAPVSLAEWEIIESVGRDAFRFRVEFLRRWILAKHSLEEAKRELEQASVRAVHLYEGAHRSHRAGRLSEAIDWYRRALAANPNHARAQLGLGQALYESGRLEAATEAFEKAYRLDPESARDGLVAAQVDVASTLDADGRYDQARPHYLRVLDILPDSPNIRERLRDSWRATAGSHLASGRWDKAVEAYREALRYIPDDEIIKQAVVDLEQRHLESEALSRRRQQLERAVLEARLREAQGHRDRLVARMRAVLPLQLATAALVCGTSTAAVAVLARQVDATQVAIVFGTALITLAVVHSLAWRRLLSDAPAAPAQTVRLDNAPAEDAPPAALVHAPQTAEEPAA